MKVVKVVKVEKASEFIQSKIKMLIKICSDLRDLMKCRRKLCSVIVHMYETICRYGGLMLSLLVSAMTSEGEDRFTDVLTLLSSSREWINC